jgi:IclR family acetate operon transcriptional repressor
MNLSEPSSSLSTTERSFEIIDFIQEVNGATLDEIADYAEIARSTTHNHLQTLQHHGYLVKEGAEYHVGVKFLDHGEFARISDEGYRLAGDAVEKLAERTGDEVDFITENAGRGITIHEAYDPQNPFQDENADRANNYWRAGTCYHLHSTGSGKAILSGFERERVDTIVDRWGLPSNTENTITDRETLFEELERISEQGYAFSDEEYAEGLCNVSMRVERPSGLTLGAIGISIPAYRISVDTVNEGPLESLRTVVTELEENLH